MPATYEKIASTTLSSTTTSFTFNSIPSSYTDIVLIFNGIISVNGAEIGLQFNGSSSSYSDTRLRGNGSTISSMRDTGYTYIPLVVNPSNSLPSFCKADIFSYAGNKNKTVLSTGQEDRNGSGWVSSTASIWANTAAITSITVMNNSGGTFSVGTTATIYGILKA